MCTQLWSHPRYYPSIYLVVSPVTMKKKSCQDSLFLGKDFNPGPPKYYPVTYHSMHAKYSSVYDVCECGFMNIRLVKSIISGPLFSLAIHHHSKAHTSYNFFHLDYCQILTQGISVSRNMDYKIVQGICKTCTFELERHHGNQCPYIP